jgi:hypothetical protein
MPGDGVLTMGIPSEYCSVIIGPKELPPLTSPKAGPLEPHELHPGEKLPQGETLPQGEQPENIMGRPHRYPQGLWQQPVVNVAKTSESPRTIKDFINRSFRIKQKAPLVIHHRL